MRFATWNSNDNTLNEPSGLYPLPFDYKRSFKIDFIDYNGDPNDPLPTPNNKNWSFLKDVAVGFQLLYAKPFTTSQMHKLGFDKLNVSVDKLINAIPEGFELDQNYPNPFNPLLRLDFPSPGEVE